MALSWLFRPLEQRDINLLTYLLTYLLQKKHVHPTVRSLSKSRSYCWMHMFLQFMTIEIVKVGGNCQGSWPLVRVGIFFQWSSRGAGWCCGWRRADRNRSSWVARWRLATRRRYRWGLTLCAGWTEPTVPASRTTRWAACTLYEPRHAPTQNVPLGRPKKSGKISSKGVDKGSRYLLFEILVPPPYLGNG